MPYYKAPNNLRPELPGLDNSEGVRMPGGKEPYNLQPDFPGSDNQNSLSRMSLAEGLEDVTRRCDRELEKAVTQLEEPDRSDEAWEEYHAEYLRKMADYNKAAQKAQDLFIEWRAYYKKYIKPYRERFDEAESSS